MAFRGSTPRITLSAKNRPAFDSPLLWDGFVGGGYYNWIRERPNEKGLGRKSRKRRAPLHKKVLLVNAKKSRLSRVSRAEPAPVAVATVAKEKTVVKAIVKKDNNIDPTFVQLASIQLICNPMELVSIDLQTTQKEKARETIVNIGPFVDSCPEVVINMDAMEVARPRPPSSGFLTVIMAAVEVAQTTALSIFRSIREKVSSVYRSWF